MIKTKAAFLILAVASASVWGAPALNSLSGTPEHGQIVVLNGSGFGTHSDFHPAGDKLIRIFDSFNDGNLADNAYENWAIYNLENDPASYSTDRPRTALAQDGFYRRNSVGLGFLHVPGGNHSEYYASFYMRLSDAFDISSQSSGTHQFKIIRLYSSGSQTVNVYPAIGASDGFHVMVEYTVPQLLRGDMQLNDIPNEPTGWHKMTVYIKKATGPSSNDGVLKIWWDNRVVMDITDFDTEDADFSGDWAVGNYFSSASAGTYVDFDDVYLDHTLARVELGDASTYSACTSLELQAPSAWIDSAIQFQVNRGALASGSQAYLYVTNKDGTVNANGFPITIGSAAVPSAPETPVPSEPAPVGQAPSQPASGQNPPEAPLPAAPQVTASSIEAKTPEKFLSPALADGSHDTATFGQDAEEVTILDLSGRTVFQKSKLDFGNSTISWSGQDDTGRLVESGVYIAKIRLADGQFLHQSLVIVK